VTLTQGNGSRRAIVVLGKRNVGLRLERLAQGTIASRVSLFTRVVVIGLALL
jgi:hypothetical protein